MNERAKIAEAFHPIETHWTACEHLWGYQPTTGNMSCAKCSEFRRWNDPETMRVRFQYEARTAPGWHEVSGHTPGPWHLCRHLQSIEDDAGCSCGYRGVIYGPEHDIAMAICQPGHQPAPVGEEGTEPSRYPRAVELANARLISAAPDMLAELRNASWLLADISPDGLVKKQIDAAIARATGQ